MEPSVLVTSGRGVVGATNWFHRAFSSYGNPARVRALRFLEAFAAHEISSNEIGDLEHPSPRLTAAKLGDTSELMKVLTSEHLDWAAELLWVERGWFNGRHLGPHRVHPYNTAQNPAYHLPLLVDWLATRMASVAPNSCRLRAYSTVERATDNPAGWVTLVYEEQFMHERVEGFSRMAREEKTRYVILADRWPLDAGKWMLRLAAIFAAAMKVDMLIKGSIVNDSALIALQNGNVFIDGFKPRGLMLPHLRGGAVVFQRVGWKGGEFHGDDLVNGWSYENAPWFSGFRKALTQELAAANDDALLATMKPFSTSSSHTP